MKGSTRNNKMKQAMVSIAMVATGWLALMPAAQASLTLDSMRYVFTGDKGALSVTVSNPDKRTFGGQAWVDNIVEKDTRPSFVVTPSFFRVKGENKQVLRIIKASDHMSSDKESIYWLNLQDIPPALEGSGLAIALRTRVKLLYRPAGLVKGRVNAEENITVQNRPGSLALVNTTPYIFAVSSVLDDKGATQKLSSKAAEQLLMFMPGDAVDISGLKVTQVTAINDYGEAKTYRLKAQAK